MKCPVCENECGELSVCQQCGFNEVGACFLNKEDAEHWMQTVVVPYRDEYNQEGLFIIREPGYREEIEKYGRYGRYKETTFYCPERTLVGINSRKKYPKIISIPDDIKRVHSFGYMREYEYGKLSDGTWHYSESKWKGKLVMPSSLTSMSERAFIAVHAKVIDFSKVTCNNLVISEFAFSGSSMERIIFPERLESIEMCAFQDCNNLDHFTIKHCYEIKAQAFLSCDKLRYVVLENVGKVWREAFNYCKSLQHIFLGSNTYLHPHWLGNANPQVHYPGEWEIVDGKIIIKDKK